MMRPRCSRPASVVDQVRLAWLAASIATIGGALGGALETHETVREAAYTYQPDTDPTTRPLGTPDGID